VLDESVSEVTENATCELTDKCVGLQCCVSASTVPLNFAVTVNVDACQKEVYIKLERIQYTIPFHNYTWGT